MPPLPKEFYEELRRVRPGFRKVDEFIIDLEERGKAWIVKKGQSTRIVCIERAQLTDVCVWNANNPEEHFWDDYTLTRETPGGKGVRVFDLEGIYVIPGLWNCHVHLGGIFSDPKHLMNRESPIDAAIRAGRDAIDALRVGVTGLRVVGQPDYTDVAWRDAFNAGVFVGPRLFVCGPAVSVTGG